LTIPLSKESAVVAKEIFPPTTGMPSYYPGPGKKEPKSSTNVTAGNIFLTFITTT
jgi:hypothetical protein